MDRHTPRAIATQEVPLDTPVIEISNLRKTFGPKVAVDNLDLTIHAGELIGMIGPNGAGKTTTIRIVMSILFPDSGHVRVLGRDSALKSKDRIGYLPEERGLYKKMKVGAFLAYIARLKGIDAGEANRRAAEWLARLELGDVAKKRSEELSKGMQQKIQFASALIHDPDVLILDEPFSGLDPVNARMLQGFIAERRRAGKTIIFSTHQMSQAEALCDRVVMIHEGKKVLDNTPEEIRSRFDPRAVAIDPVGSVAEAERSLRSLAFVSGVIGPEGQAENGGAGGATRGGRSRQVLAQLADGVSATGSLAKLVSVVPATRAEVVRPSLEDVFVEIVKGGTLTPEERVRLLAGTRGDSSGD
ncbi:MAG: ATP-binding cassette domain-containing protein [Phycisphaerales bacterium]|nr:MAG: ATP-binding cassette domain-containing protein [Phycisphaerales bacterium]